MCGSRPRIQEQVPRKRQGGYSAREREGRESSILVWNKEGLELYYMVEKTGGGVQFQSAIFCTDQWVGELGAKGQQQEGC